MKYIFKHLIKCCIAAIAFFITSCSTSVEKRPEPVIVDTTPGQKNQTDTIARIEITDTTTTQATSSPKRALTPADIQYLDLTIIEEHPEIILYYEDAAETIAFANELKAYFKSRHADMRRNGVPTPEAEKRRSQKFYIHHVGDNLFRVYVFDEWGDGGK